MDSPTLSVITAVYRNADTIEELWARVAQTLGDAALSFEMIFVDDACPAASGATIANIARQDDIAGEFRSESHHPVFDAFALIRERERRAFALHCPGNSVSDRAIAQETGDQDFFVLQKAHCGSGVELRQAQL